MWVWYVKNEMKKKLKSISKPGLIASSYIKLRCPPKRLMSFGSPRARSAVKPAMNASVAKIAVNANAFVSQRSMMGLLSFIVWFVVAMTILIGRR